MAYCSLIIEHSINLLYKKLGMAIAKNNPFLQGVSGKIGNNLVVKQYSYGTVITAMPDMSRVKRTPLQKLKQKVFAQAVAYAKDISRNPTKKAAYAKKLKKGENVYRSALKEYLKKMKKEGKY